MQGLDRVAKRRSILFEEHVRPNFDDVVGTDSDEESVEGSVVQMAEGQAVADNGLPLGFFVRDDVSRIEEFIVTQSAESALVPIRPQYSFPERPLMEPPPGLSGDVRAAGITRLCSRPLSSCRQSQVFSVIHGDRKGKDLRCITDDKHGPSGDVFSWHKPMEVDQGKPLLHRESESAVVPVVRVCAAVSVPE